jgi:5-methylcytosine-specific restriction endonuclease McrA
MRNYRNYTDKDIIENAKHVKSLAQLLKSLGLKSVGGNYSNMRRRLQKLNVDTSHWLGQGWSKDKQLKDWSDYTRVGMLKPHLLRERGKNCQNCNLEKWMGLDLKLEVHHVNGDRTDNRPENLLLLCPNCHSITDNWRKPNFIQVETKNPFKEKKTTREKAKIGPKKPRTKINWPELNVLLRMLEQNSFTTVAKNLGVSDNAIRKHLRGKGVNPSNYSFYNLVRNS